MARRPSSLRAPFLKRVWTDMDSLAERQGFPFDLPLVRHGGVDLTLTRPVTILVGENGTGKSTILEAIAEAAGFGKAGGSRDHLAADQITEKYRDRELDDFSEAERATRSAMLARAREDTGLGEVLRFAWLPKVGRGFFFRAETFHRLARFLDETAVWDIAPGLGPQHLKMSHAEGFVDFFSGRFEAALRSGRHHLFIFDEPESALSPQRQIEFMAMLRALEQGGTVQIIIATHAPLLMAYPGADLRRIVRNAIEPCRLEETAHFRFLREFFEDPAGFVSAHLEG
ncbi:AAA family ATPase [Labrys wisconsinensis]|uniref:ATPase n=1 Tax=Labrys wisconsinensis TaxID=425677 RepID=A0ABU0JBE3_9HYPH|nr:AAA family ATPase [Labrys wisconsinensis]MDQ0471593.1 putative ATPase [Labrys wisconsinensis]